jgi:hypothetical protein
LCSRVCALTSFPGTTSLEPGLKLVATVL